MCQPPPRGSLLVFYLRHSASGILHSITTRTLCAIAECTHFDNTILIIAAFGPHKRTIERRALVRWCCVPTLLYECSSYSGRGGVRTRSGLGELRLCSGALDRNPLTTLCRPGRRAAEQWGTKTIRIHRAFSGSRKHRQTAARALRHRIRCVLVYVCVRVCVCFDFQMSCVAILSEMPEMSSKLSALRALQIRQHIYTRRICEYETHAGMFKLITVCVRRAVECSAMAHRVDACVRVCHTHISFFASARNARTHFSRFCGKYQSKRFSHLIAKVFHLIELLRVDVGARTA